MILMRVLCLVSVFFNVGMLMAEDSGPDATTPAVPLIIADKVIGSGSQDCYELEINNNMIKFKVLAYQTVNGVKGINSGVILGGASGTDGEKPDRAMPFDPSAKYAFSFEIKGNIPEITIKFLSWPATVADKSDYFQGRQVIMPRPSTVSPSAEWTEVKGSFKTSPETVKGAIWLQVWCSEKYGLNVKPGQTIEIRNFILKKKIAATSAN